MQSKEETRGAWLAGTAAAILMGVALALGLCLLVLLGVSVGVSAGGIREGAMPLSVALACAVGALAGGGFAVRHGEGLPLVVGLLTGVGLLAVLAVVGWAVYGGLSWEGRGWWMAVAALVGGCLSALLPRRRKRRK